MALLLKGNVPCRLFPRLTLGGDSNTAGLRSGQRIRHRPRSSRDPPPWAQEASGSNPAPQRLTYLGFLFLGMHVLRHCALDTRSGCRRTSSFVTGVDSFCFLGAFFGRLLWERNCTNDGFPSSL